MRWQRSGVRRWLTAGGAALALAVLGGLPEAGAQCALCRQALESSGDIGLISGLYWSIVLMLSVPTLLVTGVGALLYRSWRAKAGPAAAAAVAPQGCKMGT